MSYLGHIYIEKTCISEIKIQLGMLGFYLLNLANLHALTGNAVKILKN